MSEVYTTPVRHLMAAVTNGDFDSVDVHELWLTCQALVPWLVDIACSYPPETVLDDVGVDRAAFDPVFRFVVLLKVINLLSQEAWVELLRALTRDPGEAELLLLDHCPVAYPATREIYEAWMSHLEPLATSAEWDAPMFRVRAKALGARLQHGYRKDLTTMVQAEIPIQMLVGGVGIRGLVQGADNFAEERTPLFRALRDMNVDLELYDMHFREQRFQCFEGRAQICKSREAQCVSGTRSVADLPDVRGCSVRNELRDLGYPVSVGGMS